MINIYVGNLPFSTNEADLQELFGKYGSVARTQIVMDRETGRSRGFGFVEMNDAERGREAIADLNGAAVGGRPLTVNEAKPRQPQGALRNYSGGFRSVGGYRGLANLDKVGKPTAASEYRAVVDAPMDSPPANVGRGYRGLRDLDQPIGVVPEEAG